MLGALLAAAALATTVIGAPTAGAADQRWTTPGVFILQNGVSYLRLDSNAERAVYALSGNGGSYQKWQLQPSGDGYCYLRNVATGFMLDSNHERKVYTHRLNGGSYQQWRTVNTSYGATLENKATGFMLDSNWDGDVYMLRKNDGLYQRWFIRPA